MDSAPHQACLLQAQTSEGRRGDPALVTPRFMFGLSMACLLLTRMSTKSYWEIYLIFVNHVYAVFLRHACLGCKRDLRKIWNFTCGAVGLVEGVRVKQQNILFWF